MSRADPVIRAEGLSKRLGKVQAVKDLSFEVQPGTVFGLLGKNGAGKTTAIRLLLGLLHPDAGRSTVFGEESRALSRAARRRIGYLSEKPLVDGDLPLPYLLRYVSAFFESWDWERTNDLARRLAIPQDRSLDELSAGEKRKAELLLVLAQDPDLLILDDPAVGLDVTMRREFLWAALEVAREAGKSVLFTSHVLTDVERIADRRRVRKGGSWLGRHLSRLGQGLRTAFMAAWTLRGPILASLAVFLADDPRAGAFLAVSAGLLASWVVGIWWSGSTWLYLLGVDYREQLLHNLKVLFQFAALPTLAAALAAAALTGLTAMRLALAALVAGVLLLRAGWYGLPRLTEFSAGGCCLGGVLALAAPVVFIAYGDRLGAGSLLGMALIASVVGAFGLVRRLRRLDEAELRRIRSAEGGA